jgi:hypothetical protein
MSGIVQQKSAVATGTSVSATFDSPTGNSNLIIAALFTNSQPASTVNDTGDGQQYQIALDQQPQAGYLFEIYFHKNANLSYNSLTVNVSLSGSDTAHLHIFEVAGGYDSTEQSGANWQSTNSLNGTVSTSGATTHANSFVLAMFADNFGSGVTWTPGAGFTAGQTTAGGHVVFSEGREVTSTGVQTATASQNFSSVIGSGIATFYASGGPPPPPPPTSGTFLGSVRVVSSAPAGARNPFLGTVKVVGSVPSGATNPYLGQVVEVSSVPSGDSNPSLGEVVVVSSAPAGAADPFLGSVINT